MLQIVEPVSEEIMIAIAKLHAENREDDFTFVLVKNLSGKFPSAQIRDASFRMYALANFLLLHKGEPWTIKSPDVTYTLVNEALYRAAAVAPLTYHPDEKIGSIQFDENRLMEFALARADIDGVA